MNQEMCFYVPGSRHVQDGARKGSDGQYRGQYSGETLEAMARRVPDVTLCTFDDALAQTRAIREAQLCPDPVAITDEHYDEMLNVLPPCKWTRHAGAECFFVSEAIDCDIHAWFVKIGPKHWELNRSRFKTPAAIVEEVVLTTGKGT